MARYVDVSAYEDCRIIANAEDVGFAVKDLPTAEKRLEKGDKIYQVDNAGNIYESEIKRIVYDTVDGLAFDDTAIGKSLFLNYDEAAKKAKECEENA